MWAVAGLFAINAAGLTILLLTDRHPEPEPPCCCGMVTVPAGWHFRADTSRIHTPRRCQPIAAYIASGGRP